MWLINCQTPAQTQALGAALGRAAEPGWVVALSGDLGAGKTCFSQGVGEGLCVEEDVVSPTFILIAEYEGRLPLLHADVYRLRGDELPGVGLEESLDGWPGLALVEWASRFPEVLPADHITVHLAIEGEARQIRVAATGPVSAAALEKWRLRHG